MSDDRLASILVNDLDSMVHRIEMLPAHPEYTNALIAVQTAKTALAKGRSELHQRGVAERLAKRARR